MSDVSRRPILGIRLRPTRVLAIIAVGAASACASAAPRQGAATAPSSSTRPASAATAQPATSTPAAAASPRAYAVGSRTTTMVDTSRPTLGDASRGIAAATSRRLPVLILYPATGSPSSAAIPPAQPGAPIANGRFPLVEFSHGVTASGPEYAPLLAGIARAGYVVVAPTFPMTSGQGAWKDLTDYANQPADVAYVLSRMAALDAQAGDPLAGHLDLSEIAVAGHSLGAMTTLGFFNSCCVNARVKAAVAVSGVLASFGGGDFSKPPSIPLLLIHGQQDRTVPYSSSTDTFAKLPGPRGLLTVPAGTHTGVLTPPGRRSLTGDLIVAFLDLELRHDAARWNAIAAELRPGDVASLAVAGGLPAPRTAS
ncbi:MAG: phospholipase/Carboxylesterase [Acidimicrobiales bacterium]|nr:phospholipase/Carboxylesterase [Acidimicrobiales bacterium]